MTERRKSRGGAVVFSTTKRIFIVAILIVLISAILFARGFLNDKKSEYARKVEEIEKLEFAIQDEDDKASNLKKNESKVLGNEEMESLARSELGLIKRDEIVIKYGDNEIIHEVKTLPYERKKK